MANASSWFRIYRKYNIALVPPLRRLSICLSMAHGATLFIFLSQGSTELQLSSRKNGSVHIIAHREVQRGYPIVNYVELFARQFSIHKWGVCSSHLDFYTEIHCRYVWSIFQSSDERNHCLSGMIINSNGGLPCLLYLVNRVIVYHGQSLLWFKSFIPGVYM